MYPPFLIEDGVFLAQRGVQRRHRLLLKKVYHPVQTNYQYRVLIGRGERAAFSAAFGYKRYKQMELNMFKPYGIIKTYHAAGVQRDSTHRPADRQSDAGHIIN